MLKAAKRVQDPFCGTGKIFLLNRFLPSLEIHGIEIEPEWARLNPRTTIGSALALPFACGSFDAICTSPTYGNRIAATTIGAGDFTYITHLGKNLSNENSGRLLWGPRYRAFHISAWQESARVLYSGGLFVLNIKNHIRDGDEMFVTEWHIETLEGLGFRLLDHRHIDSPGIGRGENREKRVPYESIVLFRKERG